MEQIELIEVEMKYADDIWSFRQEILVMERKLGRFPDEEDLSVCGEIQKRD